SKFKSTEVGELSYTENKAASIIVDPTERIIAVHVKMLMKMIVIMVKHHCQLMMNITLKPIQLISKLILVAFLSTKRDIAKITALLKNNTVVQYEFDLKIKHNDYQVSRSISMPGHRSFVRTVSCSSDGYSILSACDQSVKIWRSEEQKCATTLPCDASLCSVFVPGNNHCIIGTKNGKLNIFDIDKHELVNSIDAHDGFVKCICLSQARVTSGGSDKEIKFWDFELVRDEKQSESRKMLSLSVKRTLQMPEEALCLKYSPDGKKLAIALLDSTVQVLFADSLKLAFSLYGHEFPVSCLDISHDNSLIITGSSDRTIRIWSMEFGSCNKRLKIANEKGLPNDKSITCLQFLPKTHLFFSGSKDHLVRQWDADNFQKIITLKGHQNEITAMTVHPDGTFVVTASKDRSIRTWEKTREPLILQEQQEIEAEEREKETEDLPTVPGEVNKEVALPGMKTPQTIRTVDQLIEALELYEVEVKQLKEYELQCEKADKKLPPPPTHMLFIAYRVNTPIEYMKKIALKIKPSELEGVLLHLPFNYALEFLKVIAEFVDRGWETEFCEKCVTFLVRVHFDQISTTQSIRPVINKLKEKLFQQMHHIRDAIGFAKVVSNLHLHTIESQEDISSMFSELMKKKRNRKRIERPVVSFI
ncbi:WD repeat-containing protein 3, partial [Caerostris extrusa]